METTARYRELTDGSKVFDVVAVDGSQHIVISAMDEKAAAEIQQCLADHAAYITIEGV